jgi:hypothetical protein
LVLAGSALAADLPALASAALTGEPREQAALPFAVSLNLRRAYPVAMRRLLAVPECRGLFDGLALGGDVALRRTLYYPPEALGVERVCRLGGNAFTAVGRVQTGLCPRFARLPVERAALVLIHEALHLAGLPERPQTPGAMTTTEINDRIADRCGL